MPYDDSISRLFEKIDTLTDVLHNVDKNVSELKNENTNIIRRLDDLEKQGYCDHEQIAKLKAEMQLLKNDKKWVSLLFSCIGGFVMWLLSNIHNFLSILKH